jgi:hypothetical protein
MHRLRHGGAQPGLLSCSGSAFGPFLFRQHAALIPPDYAVLWTSAGGASLTTQPNTTVTSPAGPQAICAGRHRFRRRNGQYQLHRVFNNSAGGKGFWSMSRLAMAMSRSTSLAHHYETEDMIALWPIRPRASEHIDKPWGSICLVRVLLLHGRLWS